MSEKLSKINIIKSVKNSYVLAYQEKSMIAKICWLPVLLFLIFSFLDYAFGLTYNLDYKLDNYLYAVIDSLIYCLFAVGLYRFLILGSNEQKVWEYKKGIEIPRTILAIPYFMKFGKPERWIFIIGTVLAIAFTALYDLKAPLFAHYLETNNVIDISFSTALIFQCLHWGFKIFEYLVYASLIFVWPIIAISKSFNLQDMKVAINAIRGNIIRVAIITSIIYLPFFFIDQIIIIFMWLIGENVTGTAFTLFADITQILQSIFYYIFLCIDVAFISLLYKTLKDKQKTDLI